MSLIQPEINLDEILITDPLEVRGTEADDVYLEGGDIALHKT